MRHWIFDFDGTLVDSAPAILQAFEAALNESGLTAQVPLDNRLIGPPLAETLARISGSNDPALIVALSERFKSRYDRDGVNNTPAYRGVDALLTQLSGDGACLHIATNKRLSATLAIIERLGWHHHFSSIYALDMIEPRIQGKAQLLQRQIAERGLTAGETAYVGDKLEDGQAAASNSLRFHYAAWGYGNLKPSTLPSKWHWLRQPLDLLMEQAPT
jgi:phosphoglycolate phosphatase